jgi:hypothetical protein
MKKIKKKRKEKKNNKKKRGRENEKAQRMDNVRRSFFH